MPRGAASLAEVLALGSLAALTASLGPALLRVSKRPLLHTIGVADALAAGMMLGIGYTLMTLGIRRAPIGATLGAGLGVAVMYWTHVRLGIGIGVSEAAPVADERRAFVGAFVHASSEGVALGAAAAVGHTVAIVVAAMLALHNISESIVLTSQLPARSGARAPILAVASNVPQIVLGLVAFALAGWWPALLGPLLGASFGALIYLCFAELIPDSYRGAGRSSIAVVVTVAAGVVALVSGSV